MTTTSDGTAATEVLHESFTLERTYDADPGRVFHALTDEATKRRWFAEGPGFTVERYTLEPRVGGRESSSFTAPDGTPLTYDAVIHDLVPGQRLVLSYAMTVAGAPLSVSLLTLVLHPDGTGTRLVMTEQGVYFAGESDAAARVEGSRGLLERLAHELAA